MSKLPLPHQSERFSPEGLKRLYEGIRKDPAAAKAVSDAIEANPREALSDIFKLSKSQQEELSRVSDEHLLREVAPLVEELRSKEPGNMRIAIEFVGGEKHEHRRNRLFSCSLLI